MHTILFDSGGVNAWGAAVTVAMEPYLFDPRKQQLDPSEVRFVGASVGALNATILATKQSAHADYIYHPDQIRRLLSLRALWRRMVRTVVGVQDATASYDALCIDQAIAVLCECVPDVCSRLAESPVAEVEALVWNRETHAVESRDLKDPSSSLTALTEAIMHPALCDIPEAAHRVDASVAGDALMSRVPSAPVPGEKYVLILNAPSGARTLPRQFRQRFFSLLAKDAGLGQQLLTADDVREQALAALVGRPDVLLLGPESVQANLSAFRRADLPYHRAWGREAAGRIVEFLTSDSATKSMKKSSASVQEV